LVVEEEESVAEAVVVPSSGLRVNPDLLVEEDGPAIPVLPAGVYLEDEETPVGRVELFRVNGRKYTVAKRVDPGIAFRYMRAIRKRQSQESALADMLYDVLGDAVVDALADEALSHEEMASVMKAVEKHTMSVMKAAGLGN